MTELQRPRIGRWRKKRQEKARGVLRAQYLPISFQRESDFLRY